MNKTANTKTTTARGLLATLIIALALAFIMVPSLVLAANPDDEFTDPASDIVNDPDVEDPVGASSSSPAGEAGTPQPEEPSHAEGADSDPAPEPTSYSLRLIVSADDATLRDGDAVLGSHDGVHLLGFADEDALADAESYYAETAAWSDRDIALAAADDEPAESTPAPVDETTNALTLLGESVGASSSSPAGEAGTPQPELTSAAEGGTTPLVALIDTGAPDNPSVVASGTFVGDDPADNHGHATAMLEAMKSENPDIRILAIKALGDDGEGSASSVYAAIEYATKQGADIINLSLAGYATDENAAIAEAVARALENGITVIAAAGNGGYDAAYFTPANISGVFAVGACDEDGNVLEASNRGDCVSGYAVADSTSVAAARLTGWASASGDRILKDCPFLFSPEDASYDGANTPDPDSAGSLSASVNYDGVLLIYPVNGQKATISWIMNDGTHTIGSRVDPCEKLFYYPTFSPGGVSHVATRSNNSTWVKKRVVGLSMTYGSTEKATPIHGVFSGQGGTGTQLISGSGSLSPGMLDGTGVVGEQTAYFDLGYNVKATFDPGTDNVASRGTETLYVVRESKDSKGNDNFTPGLFLNKNNTAAYSQLENGGTRNAFKVPTRSDGYTFAGYYYSYDLWGSSYETLCIDANGNVPSGTTQRQLAEDICLGSDCWDARAILHAKWAKDARITLDQGGADLPGTQSLYVLGTGAIMSGPDKTYPEYTSKVRLETPKRNGWKFQGYYTGENGSGTLMINPDGSRNSSLSNTAKDATLYAKWVSVTDTYVLTLDDNGGEGGPGACYKTVINNGVEGNMEFWDKFARGEARTMAERLGSLRVNTALGSRSKPRMGSPSKKRFLGYNYKKDSADASSMVLDANLNGEGIKLLSSYARNTTAYLYFWVPGTEAAIYTVAEKRWDDWLEFFNANCTIFQTKGGFDLDRSVERNVTAPDGMAQKIDKEIGHTLGRFNIGTESTSDPGSLRGKGIMYEGVDFTWEFGQTGWGSAVINETLAYRTAVLGGGTAMLRNTPTAFADGYNTLGTLNGKTFPYGGTVVTLNRTGTILCSDRTAYATWRGWPVRLDGQGGAFVGASDYYEVYGEGLYKEDTTVTKVASLPVPGRKGYTFAGWYQRRDGTGVQVADKNGVITNSMVAAYEDGDTSWCNESSIAKPVYAHYVPNTYTITLDSRGAANGHTGTTSLYEVYGTGVFLSAEAAEGADASGAMSASANPIELPEKEGYMLTGYFSSPEGGTKYIDENGYVTAAFASNAFSEDTTLYAHWIDPRAVLPLAGGFAENMPLLWGSAFAIVGASGLVLFRALRPNRADRRKAAHGARRAARKPARQPSRASVRSNAVARPSVRTRHAR